MKLRRRSCATHVTLIFVCIVPYEPALSFKRYSGRAAILLEPYVKLCDAGVAVRPGVSPTRRDLSNVCMCSD
jgi:hypothetical protein